MSSKAFKRVYQWVKIYKCSQAKCRCLETLQKQPTLTVNDYLRYQKCCDENKITSVLKQKIPTTKIEPKDPTYPPLL